MHDFDDSLDDLIGGPRAPASNRAPVTPPASYKPQHIEACKKCGGRGRFISYAGRDCGPCFACKGAGKKTFAAPAAVRAANREKAAERKAARVAADILAFKDREPEIFAWLNAEGLKANPFPFAVAMTEAIAKYGDLTEGQLIACRKLVARAAERKAAAAERIATAPVVDGTKIEKAFAIAREKAARPGQMGVMVKPLRMASGEKPNVISLLFTPGSAGSQWEGQLFAKTIDGKKLGAIKAGRFVRKFDCTDAEAAAVLDCAENPEKAAVAYGKAWSRCGVCNRTLLNDGSIERGIGPICAEKFGW